MAQLMIEIIESQWNKAIRKYIEKILIAFGDSLVGFLSPSNPNITVYDYNVVIVLNRKPRKEDIRLARQIAREVEKELGLDVLIVPIVVEKGDLIEEEAKNIFINELQKGWKKAITEYQRRIQKAFGDSLVGFLSPSNPNITVYDYNVVIVLNRKPRKEDIRLARQIAREVEKELGLDVLIVPIVVEKGDLIEEEAYGIFGGQN